jgi:hypothetical protein
MKKIFLLSLVCYSSCALAQKSFFGVEAGINVANQRIFFPYPLSSGNQITFHGNVVKPLISVFYQREISNKLEVRIKASYAGFGFNDPNAMYYPYNATVYFFKNVDINYLMLPINLYYKANSHLLLGGGPYVSFLVGASQINGQDVTSVYHKNDFGIILGGEHDIYKNFSLNISYVIGAKNIWLNDKDSSYGYTYSVTNRALQFTLIYKFKKTN